MTVAEAEATSRITLRKNAETRVRESAQTGMAHRGRISSELIHDLEVHQVELELQNEDLRRSQSSTAQAKI